MPKDNPDQRPVEVTATIGDITEQTDMEAVVNAANAQLQSGGGVAGAIHSKAGPLLAKESAALAPIKPGQAVITAGYELPNRCIIHTLGPIYGKNTPEDTLLAECYRNSLDAAERQGIGSIALPAISTGAFGYPLDQAADVAAKAIASQINYLRSVSRIRFVLFDEQAYEAFDTALKKHLPKHYRQEK